VAMLARLPDHTPEIMMSLSQGLHTLADPVSALITVLKEITGKGSWQDFLRDEPILMR